MRNSNIELLRIISIFGIILIHILGFQCNPNFNHINLIGSGILQVIGNTGVSCFIIISGFYLIKFSYKKLWALLFKSWFIAIITWITYCLIFDKSILDKYIILNLMPIMTGKYWFITNYIFLFLLSPFLNKFKEIPEKGRNYILGILILFFYVTPTFLHYSLINDSGKGIGNIITLYFTGINLSIYLSRNAIKQNRIILYLISTIMLNLILYLFVSIDYTKDNSLLIYIQAILSFSIFYHFKFYNKNINRIAQSTLAVYILHLPLIMNITNRYIINIEIYQNSLYLMPIVLLSGAIIFLISFIVDLVLSPIIEKLNRKIFSKIKYISNNYGIC